LTVCVNVFECLPTLLSVLFNKQSYNTSHIQSVSVYTACAFVYLWLANNCPSMKAQSLLFIADLTLVSSAWIRLLHILKYIRSLIIGV